MPNPAPSASGFDIIKLDPASLIPDGNNARKHSKRQHVQLTAAIRTFGFTNPILIDDDNVIIAGHARREAAVAAGLSSVPCLCIPGLDDQRRRALALSDNRLGDLSTFDPERLTQQLAELSRLDFPVEVTGFTTAEIDILIEPARANNADIDDDVAEPDRTAAPVSRAGDRWLLGKHRMLCGSALDAASYGRLLGDERAQMIITDPPYNVPIQGHVSGLGRTRHGEFAMAAGEMSAEAFTGFLSTYMAHCARFSVDGSIHYHFMDWRHLPEILAAGGTSYTEMKALCVWNKSNGGMGSLYRSKHELVLVYIKGTAPHVNNVELGRNGRYRTNVWDYAGANTFRAGREEDLADHPTVKPVALIADAIRDCSKRGSLVLDPFAGSGTILLAAERTGRRAAAIELDPHYVDVAVRRWQQRTGCTATHADTGESFAVLAELRATEAAHD